MVSPARPKEFENLITRKYLSLLSPWSWTFMNTRDHSRIFRILEFFAEFLKSFSSLILQWLYNSWNDHFEVKNLKFCGEILEFRVKNQISSQNLRFSRLFRVLFNSKIQACQNCGLNWTVSQLEIGHLSLWQGFWQVLLTNEFYFQFDYNHISTQNNVHSREQAFKYCIELNIREINVLSFENNKR